MKILSEELNGVKLIQTDVFGDSRGYFTETFNKKRYLDFGIDIDFVQSNVSYSKLNTVRGLHYQVGEFAQGKLCQVLLGSVLDVAVDIRFGSPTFGKSYSVELSSENFYQLWIPPGFAHGFSVLSDEAIFTYKCTAIYSKAHERAILFNDPNLKINWKIDEPIVSEKDLLAKNFSDIEKDFFY